MKGVNGKVCGKCVRCKQGRRVGVSQRFSCGNLDPFFILGLRTRICNQAALGRSEGAAAADLFHRQLDVTQYAKCFFTSFL
jgi:hypothetical protein